jgi:hypothetical protein
MAIATLTYAEILGAGTVGLDPDVATRSLPSSGAHFKLHPEWRPERDCTTRYKLLAGALANT